MQMVKPMLTVTDGSLFEKSRPLIVIVALPLAGAFAENGSKAETTGASYVKAALNVPSLPR
jgi:hypothetical protein